MSKLKLALMLVIPVLLWGINVVMIKYMAAFFPPIALAATRILLASLFLMPAALYSYSKPLPRPALKSVCGVAIFCIFLHQIALTWGSITTSGTHAVLILGLNPLLTTLAASWFAGEKLTWHKSAGVFLGLSGILLIVTTKAETGGATLLGDFIMFIASLTYVIGSLYVKKSTSIVPPLTVTAYSHLMAGVLLASLGFAVHPTWVYEGAFNPWPLAILIFSAMFNMALSAVLWNTGIHHIGASTTSLFLNITPIVGVFASALFLGEEIFWQHYAALVLILIGVSLGTGVFRREKTLPDA